MEEFFICRSIRYPIETIHILYLYLFSVQYIQKNNSNLSKNYEKTSYTISQFSTYNKSNKITFFFTLINIWTRPDHIKIYSFNFHNLELIIPDFRNHHYFQRHLGETNQSPWEPCRKSSTIESSSLWKTDERHRVAITRRVSRI